MYASIQFISNVYAQNFDGTYKHPQLAAAFDNEDPEAMKNYLQQWDNGEPGNNIDGVYTASKRGTSDRFEIFPIDDKSEYILSYNWNIGYVSLEYFSEDLQPAAAA